MNANDNRIVLPQGHFCANHCRDLQYTLRPQFTDKRINS